MGKCQHCNLQDDHFAVGCILNLKAILAEQIESQRLAQIGIDNDWAKRLKDCKSKLAALEQRVEAARAKLHTSTPWVNSIQNTLAVIAILEGKPAPGEEEKKNA